MKSSTTTFAIALAISAALLTANSATAGGFSFGGGHKHGHHNHHHHGHHNHHGHHHGHHHHHGHSHHKYYYRPYVKYYTPAPVIVRRPVAPPLNITLAEEPVRVRVPIGSVLAIDGQPLGPAKGSVRLWIGNFTMPVEVLDWTANGAKIRLPNIDLAGPMRADLEVLRADGSLASKQAIELVPAAPIASGN